MNSRVANLRQAILDYLTTADEQTLSAAVDGILALAGEDAGELIAFALITARQMTAAVRASAG